MGVDPAPVRRRTPARVHLIDRVANSVIRLGGVLVIAAVLGICLYLLSVVMPLFMPGTAELRTAGRLQDRGDPITPTTAGVQLDEYASSAAIIESDGSIKVLRLDTGELLGVSEPPLPVSVLSVTPDGLIGWGFQDGSLQLGVLRASATLLTARQAADLGEQSVIPQDGPFAGFRSQTDSGSDRVTTFAIERRAITPADEPTGPLKLIDYRLAGGGRELLLTVWESGAASLNTVRVMRPLDGSEPRLRLTGRDIELQPESRTSRWSMAFGDGLTALLVEPSGMGRRYGVAASAGRSDPLTAMEAIDLTDGVPATAFVVAPGGRSLVVGDQSGRISVWTIARDPQTENADGMRLVLADRMAIGRSAILAMTVGQSDRSLAVTTASGRARVVHLTSGKRVVNLDARGLTAGIGLAPRQDGLFAIGPTGDYLHWSMAPGHPGAGWRALFGRVHYEGELEPAFIYQSSSAEDASQIKISLVPLIFGTIKATIVAMLIAAPLAVLAAIYSSEFLHRSVRSTIKPAIEMMASLPSVVLGFIAMAVVSPWIADVLPGVLLAVVVVPSGVLLGAHLWQLLPLRLLVRVPTAVHIGLIALVILGSGAASLQVGAWMERTMFGPTRSDLLLSAGFFEPLPRQEWPAWVGNRTAMPPGEERALRSIGLAFRDGSVVRAVEPAQGTPEAAVFESVVASPPRHTQSLRSWLDGLHGLAWPGWFVLLLPLGGLCAWCGRAGLRPILTLKLPSRLGTGLYELGMFGLSIGAAIGLAAMGATILSSLGLDARDSLFGPFSQRNTLVVGVVMGFAIIPIIYTISEDALSSVPSTLRSASLGAGATRWQTAWRIVLPVAGSGIFSACMIGLGRATGETMIMLMATGNTPQIDFNLFSGFRTLAANIATELPEAERGGTHYRVLFLCGLVLFALTFVINTSAEVVRQRFRKKSASL